MSSTPKIEPTTSPTPTAFGMLSRIPPEIRLKIYHELVLGGSVRFLESSKAIHCEAIEVLLQKGVCRLEFNDYKPLDGQPHPYCCNTIMNLEIRFVLRCNDNGISRQSIRRFKQWLAVSLNNKFTPDGLQPRTEPTTQSSCKISINCDKYFFFLVMPHTIAVMAPMNDFEVLTVAIADDYPAELKPELYAGFEDSKRDRLRNLTFALQQKAYERATRDLLPRLGPAQLICDGNGGHLEFHPRAHGLRKVEEEQT